MKVLIQTRVDSFDKYGGDIIHAEKTRDALKKLGVDAEMTTELFPDIASYDLVHIFNLDWVRDAYLQTKNVREQRKPIILSPLHHSFSEIEEFEQKMRFGVRRLVNPLFTSYYHREYLKNIYRAFIEFDRRKWPGTFTQFAVGMKRQYLRVLEWSDLVIPNTYLEVQELAKEFKLDIETMVVPAGVETSFLKATPDWFRNSYPELSAMLGEKFALMVGRVEPRKNQLRVIEALRNEEYPLLLIGGFNVHHPEYTWRVKRIIRQSDNVFHLPFVPHERIGSVFAACQLHILASWFETTGLVNLEAGLAGANIVSTNRGFCREYLGKRAWYIDPEDKASIRGGVRAAMRSESRYDVREHILNNYTWDRVGILTKHAYEKVLR